MRDKLRDTSGMYVHDVVANPSESAMSLLHLEQENIASQDVRLKQNYASIDLSDYHSFTLLLTDDGRLVAFSGLQKNGPWQRNIARISSRFRIAKDFQTDGLMGRGYDRSIFSGSKYLIPYQLGLAIEIGLSGVFLSRENINKRRHLQSMADRFNEFETRARYEVYPNAVNICKRISDCAINNEPACWQNVIYAKLKDDFALLLPEKRLDDI